MKNKLYVLLFFLIQTVGTLWLAVIIVALFPLVDGDKLYQIVFVIQATILGCLGIYLYRNEIIVGIKSEKTFLRFLIKSLVLLMGLLIVGAGGLRLLSQLFNDIELQNEEMAFQITKQLPFLVGLAVMCFFCPITEEIVFRYCIQSALIEKCGRIIGIVIAAATFAIFHSGISISFLYYFAISLVFGVYYQQTNNLAMLILIHGVNNLIALLT